MKVILVGLPKSGTSMLAFKLKAGLETYYNIESQLLFEPEKKSIEEQTSDYSVAKILYAPNHFSRSDDIIEIGRLFNKNIIIVRDPRDILVSETLYRWFKSHNPNKEHFDKALNLIKQKESQPSLVNLYDISRIDIYKGSLEIQEYQDYLQKQYHNFLLVIEALLNEKWFITRYEDIVEGNTANINNYLEFDLLEIAKHIESNNKTYVRIARSKKYGNWKNWFTKDDVKFFKPIFEPFLDNFGYKDDWELNQEQVINPRISSEYVLKIFNSDEMYL